METLQGNQQSLPVHRARRLKSRSTVSLDIHALGTVLVYKYACSRLQGVSGPRFRSTPDLLKVPDDMKSFGTPGVWGIHYCDAPGDVIGGSNQSCEYEHYAATVQDPRRTPRPSWADVGGRAFYQAGAGGHFKEKKRVSLSIIETEAFQIGALLKQQHFCLGGPPWSSPVWGPPDP